MSRLIYMYFGLGFDKIDNRLEPLVYVPYYHIHSKQPCKRENTFRYNAWPYKVASHFLEIALYIPCQNMIFPLRITRTYT